MFIHAFEQLLNMCINLPASMLRSFAKWADCAFLNTDDRDCSFPANDFWMLRANRWESADEDLSAIRLIDRWASVKSAVRSSVI